MFAHSAGLMSRPASRCQRAILLGPRLSLVAPFAGLFNALGLSSLHMGQTEESAFMRAQFAALKIAVRAEADASRAKIDAVRKATQASQAQIAALVDAVDRSSVLTGLQLLIARSHDVAARAAMQPFPFFVESATTPKWISETWLELFASLSAKVSFATEIAEDIRAEISMAKCTEAPPGCPKRPSKKNPSADSVHAHVKPVVAAVARVLTSGKWTVSGSEEAQPRNVAFLYEQGYRNCNPNSGIPDFSATLFRGEGTPAQLTDETQVGIVECDKCEPSQKFTPSDGEARTAAYVAQSLYPAIACGVNLKALVMHPLSGYGVYTNSSTSTLIEVRITGTMVEVFRSRMPFLPGGTLSGGTLDADSSPTACGAVAFGLGVMAMLGDPRLRASASAAYIQDICPRPEGVEVPALAEFLGRGKFARVFRLGTIAVKVPVSSLTPTRSWNVAIDAEASALMRLGTCRPPCCHFPALIASAPLPIVNGTPGNPGARVALPFVAQPTIAGASSILLSVTSGDSVGAGVTAVDPTRPVQGLLTTPICTMLPEALESLRRRIPLGERTVQILQFLSLSAALPLLAAQAHARSTGLSHFDAHTMNVGLDGWNADAAVAQLKSFASGQRDHPRTETASCVSTASPATLMTVDLLASTSDAAMCRRVILNDWGCAQKTGVAGFSNKHAVAADTAQAINLVRLLLRYMLDSLSDDDLVDSASEGVAAWWALTLPRLIRISNELQAPGAVLAEGVAPQLFLLRTLGLASNTVDAAGATTTLSAGDNTPIDIAATTDSADIASVEAFCSAATAATGCSCYDSGFVLRPFNAPSPSTHVTCSDVGSNDAQVADTTGASALLGTVARGSVVASADEAVLIASLGAIAILGVATASIPAQEFELAATSDDGSKTLAVSTVVILVSNIANFLSERALRAMLAEFGVVIACMILPPETSTKPGHRALIQYADAAVAARVVGGLTNFEVGGQLLVVAAAPVALVERYLVTANSESHAA